MWAIVGYFVIPRIFGGASKKVQYAIMIGLPLALWLSVYRQLKGVHSLTLKNKGAAERKMREAKEIVRRGPQTPGYDKAAQIVALGISY